MNPDSPQSPRDELEARLTALLLGELSADEAASLRATLAQDIELARLHDRLKLAFELVRETALAPELDAQAKPEPVTLTPERRDTLLALFKKPALKPITRISTWRTHRREWLQLAAMIVALMVVTGMLTLGMNRRTRMAMMREDTVLFGDANLLDGKIRHADAPASAPVAAYVMVPEIADRPANPAPPEYLNALSAATVENQTRSVTVEVVPQAKPQAVTPYYSRGNVRLEPKGETAAPKSGAEAVPAKPGENRLVGRYAYVLPAPPSGQLPLLVNGAKPDVTVHSVNTLGFVDVTTPPGDFKIVQNPTAASAGRPAIQDQERGEVARRSSTGIVLPMNVVTGDASVGADEKGGTPLPPHFSFGTLGDRPVVSNESLGESRRDAIADTDGEAKSLGYRFGTFAGQGQAGGGMGGGGGGGRLSPAGSGAMKAGQAGAKDVKELTDNFRSVDDRAEGLKRDAKFPETGKPALQTSDYSLNLISPSGRRVMLSESKGQSAAYGESDKKQSGVASGLALKEGELQDLSGFAVDKREAEFKRLSGEAVPEVRRQRQMGTSRPVPAPATPPSSDELSAGKPVENSELGRSLVRESAKPADAKGDRVGGLRMLSLPTAPTEPAPQAAAAFGIIPQAEAEQLTQLAAIVPKDRSALGVDQSNLKAWAATQSGNWTIRAETDLPAPKPAPADFTIGFLNFATPSPSARSTESELAARPFGRSKPDVVVPGSFVASTLFDSTAALPYYSDAIIAPGNAKNTETLDTLSKERLAQKTDPSEAKARFFFSEQNQDANAVLPKALAQLPAANSPVNGRQIVERGLSALTAARPSQNFDLGLKTKGVFGDDTVQGLDRKETEQLGKAVEPEAVKLGESSPGRIDKFYKIELPALLSASDEKAVAVVTARGKLRDSQGSSSSAYEKAVRAEIPKLAILDESKQVLAEKERAVAQVELQVEEMRKSEEVQKSLKELEPALKAPAKSSAPAPIPQPEVSVAENAFSTFSLNVTDVSFKLAAASLEKGLMPDVSTLRSEEFINAFDYHDPEPTGNAPITFAWERARYPFAHDRDLLRFSVKTAASGRQPGRPLNLVLLLDNSGSMERADRVLIRQECLRVLAGQLQPQDRVSVVAFARTARLWVDGLPGAQAGELPKRVGGLTPEGGTNLEEAMNLAYRTAQKHFLPNGLNRVVLLTDGAANLGDVEPESLKQQVEAQRKQGIALDCFGIGWDGYNDELLEILSRNGDGRYGFLNTPEAATSDFATQLAGALNVAASDVKVQVEWNPRRVTAFRQIGYAKHQLKKEQFRDNAVDAAELAAAESGNALYTVQVNPQGEGPLGVVRVRFKVPGTEDYREHEWTVPYQGASKPLEQSGNALKLAATASAFSEWLAGSPFAAEVTADQLLGYLAGVPEQYAADPRPKQLEWMIRQTKSMAGR